MLLKAGSIDLYSVGIYVRVLMLKPNHHVNGNKL
jgi:hypothetical protein